MVVRHARSWQLLLFIHFFSINGHTLDSRVCTIKQATTKRRVRGFTRMITVSWRVFDIHAAPQRCFPSNNLVRPCVCVCALIRAKEPLLYKDRLEWTDDRSRKMKKLECVITNNILTGARQHSKAWFCFHVHGSGSVLFCRGRLDLHCEAADVTQTWRAFALQHIWSCLAESLLEIKCLSNSSKRAAKSPVNGVPIHDVPFCNRFPVTEVATMTWLCWVTSAQHNNDNKNGDMVWEKRGRKRQRCVRIKGKDGVRATELSFLWEVKQTWLTLLTSPHMTTSLKKESVNKRSRRRERWRHHFSFPQIPLLSHKQV